MSDYERSDADGDDQSEDGEIKKSPVKSKIAKMEEEEISLSEDEGDTADSLEIKPPQAAIYHKERSHRYEKMHRKSHHRSREHRERREERQRRHHRDRREMREMKAAREARGEGREHSERPRPKEDLRERLERDRRERSKVEREKEVEARPEKKLVKEETVRDKAERLEREHRKERLLQADREMERQKEAYRKQLEDRRRRRYVEREKQTTAPEVVRDRSRRREEKVEEKEEPVETEVHELVVVSDDKTETESDTESDSSSTVSRHDKQSPPLAAKDSPDSPHERDSGKKNSDYLEDDYAEDDDDDDDDEEDEEEIEEEAEVKMEAETVAYKEEQEVTKSLVLLKDELPPYLPAIQGCRSVEEFQCLNRIEEGTYGVVYRARDKRTEEIVALKRLKMEKEKEGFPITSLREINTLLKAQHPNIVTVREIVVGSNMDKIFIVMDYVEHDLKSLMETMKMKKQVFIPGEVKCLMLQLLRAVSHLHDNWILHRDLKTSNLLLSHKGILKVGDFGLAREYGSPLKPYTPIVVTLWYRAPELLLGVKEYSTPVDMWSVGCIFGELLSMEPLFPGKSEVDQLNRIFKDLGTPNEKIWPGYNKLPAVQKMTFTEFPVSQLRTRFGNTMMTEMGLDLMNRFLTYDPTRRVTAEDALHVDYFREAPLPIDPAMFPTWPAKSELGHRKVAASPKPPSGGKEYKQLGDTDEDMNVGGGFHMGGMEQGKSAMGAGFSLRF